MKRAVIVFTRIPRAGQTKTRLQPVYPPAECRDLHVHFLTDIARAVGKVKAAVRVYYTPAGTPRERAALAALFGAPQNLRCQPVGCRSVSLHAQTKGSLAHRMRAALRDTLVVYDRVLLIGSDIPELTAADLDRAFQILETKDVVFGPAADGGYYLVGLKQDRPAVFDEQAHDGGPRVLQNILAVIRPGLRVGFVRAHADLDTPADLADFVRRQQKRPYRQQLQTYRYLARRRQISLIIPTYNESRTLPALLSQLKKLRGQCEILFVDGGSTDDTVALIGSSYRVLTAPKGRAAQMNAGARAAAGDILFFLHCDSRLPSRPLAEIRRVLSRYPAGGFGVRFPSRNFFMRTNEWLSNRRLKYGNIIFGDQGLFIGRDLFLALGGFPALPLMEDYEFSRRLKARGLKLGLTKGRITTSDRRYPPGTINKLRVMGQMVRLRAAYRRGVPIEEIAARYRDIR